MKFLCGNCKAKYQIADEKITGRTLRMKCRRCQHDIIIRGDEAEASSPDAMQAQPASAAARGSRRPSSALGADFRRSMANPAPAAPPPPAPATLDQWHVAINDVPVGPIRKEEVARKIQTGAVNGESLCWREGFDDWRPLKEVAELSALLRQQRPPAPPRPAPVGRGIGQRKSHESRPRIRPVAPTPPPRGPGAGSSPAAPRPSEPARPAARSNVVPIGGRLGAAAAPAFDAEDDFADEATRVSEPGFSDEAGPMFPEPAPHAQRAAGAPFGAHPEPQPMAAEPPMAFAPAPTAMGGAGVSIPASEAPPRRRRGIPVGAWIAIAAAGAFGVTLAAFVATNLLAPPAEPVAQATPGEVETPEVAQPDLVLDEPLEAETPEEAPEEAAEAPTQPRVRRTAPATTNTTNNTAAKNKNLTAEQRAMLERMSGGGSTGQIADIDTGDSTSGSRTAQRGQLTAQQLSNVVGSNRRSLQRCYETAIRGVGTPPTIRLDVDITVGASGGVTNVGVRGDDIGGLKTCVNAQVRRWRFPASGDGARTSFPVVFQPGA